MSPDIEEPAPIKPMNTLKGNNKEHAYEHEHILAPCNQPLYAVDLAENKHHEST